MTDATSCFTREVRHEGLGKCQVVSGPDEALVEAQATALRRTWEHEHALGQIQHVLAPALEVKHALDWEQFKRNDPYVEPQPAPVVYLEYPPEPQPEAPRYWPTPGQTEILDKTLAEQRKREASELYVRDYTAWAETVRKTAAENQRRYMESFIAVEQWKSRRREHKAALASANAAVDQRKADYETCRPAAVVDYFRRVLAASKHPETFPRDFDLEYVAEAKTLIVEQALPAPDTLPCVKGVRYVKTRREFVEVPLAKAQFSSFYDDIVHQICLRRLHELFHADVAGVLGAVIFNGWVDAAEEFTGTRRRICVLSVRAGRAEFQALNLRDTEARVCLRAFQAAAGLKPHRLAPVVPLQSVNRGKPPENVPAAPAPTA